MKSLNFSKALFFGIALTGIAAVNTQAQVLDPSDDGIVPRESLHFNNDRVVPYPFLRQDETDCFLHSRPGDGQGEPLLYPRFYGNRVAHWPVVG